MVRPLGFGDVHAFDAATRVTRAGDGRYEAFLDDQWSIGGRLNGGYLLALMTRAALAEAGRRGAAASCSRFWSTSGRTTST